MVAAEYLLESRFELNHGEFILKEQFSKCDSYEYKQKLLTLMNDIISTDETVKKSKRLFATNAIMSYAKKNNINLL